MKFMIVTALIWLTLIAVSFYLGREEGCNSFANECISIGVFVVWDHGQDRNRRFQCMEVLEAEDTHASPKTVI